MRYGIGNSECSINVTSCLSEQEIKLFSKSLKSWFALKNAVFEMSKFGTHWFVWHESASFPGRVGILLVSGIKI